MHFFCYACNWLNIRRIVFMPRYKIANSKWWWFCDWSLIYTILAYLMIMPRYKTENGKLWTWPISWRLQTGHFNTSGHFNNAPALIRISVQIRKIIINISTQKLITSAIRNWQTLAQARKTNWTFLLGRAHLGKIMAGHSISNILNIESVPGNWPYLSTQTTISD